MLSIKLICVGKLKEKFYTEASGEYLKRLSAYCDAKIEELPEQRLPDTPSDAEIRSALEKEKQLILQKIPKGAAVAAMCIEGKETGSVEFSHLLSELAVKGGSKICFVIGSSFGLHEELKNQAHVKISMSRMTFPHHLARVMLLEQIYRAFKIAEGSKYHK